MSLSWILSFLNRRRTRGATRLTLLAASRMKGLQSVCLPADGGSLFVALRETSSHGLLAGWLTEDHERRRVARCLRPGQVALDIGAHWGLYTVLLASRVGPDGRVFAIEPCPRVLPQLRKTAALWPNVTLLELGLLDKVGRSPLSVPSDASTAGIRTGAESASAAHGDPLVETTTLDTLLLDGRLRLADFIKCDVEGAEALVFRGGRRLLDRADAPVILFEHNPVAMRLHGLGSGAAAAVLAEFEAACYRLFVFEPDGRLDPVASLPERFASVLAIPDSRMESWAAD